MKDSTAMHKIGVRSSAVVRNKKKTDAAEWSQLFDTRCVLFAVRPIARSIYANAWSRPDLYARHRTSQPTKTNYCNIFIYIYTNIIRRVVVNVERERPSSLWLFANDIWSTVCLARKRETAKMRTLNAMGRGGHCPFGYVAIWRLYGSQSIRIYDLVKRVRNGI